LLAGNEQCSTYRLPKPGDTVFLSGEHWKPQLGVPCQQARFQLLLTKAIGRGYESQVYEAKLQQCTAAAQNWSQVLSPQPDATDSNSSSCQPFVNACQLPSTLTEPGRRLALKILHKNQNIPTLAGCDLPWMEGARGTYLKIHSVLSGMPPDADALKSYLVGDVYAAHTSTEVQREAGVPAQLLDLVDGHDLWPVVGRLGPADTHRVVSQVLRTLVELNKKGWVHQDIHVGQIVCSARPPSTPHQSHMAEHSVSNCVVVDFDELEFLGNATDMPARLQGVYHRAPEYYRGRVATTSDVWSLGFAMILLRCGWPFEYADDLQRGRESNAQALAAMRASQPYIRLLQVEWDFIQRCMAYDWKERPTTAMLASDSYISKGVTEKLWGVQLEYTEDQGPRAREATGQRGRASREPRL
jgi:serine/threonine protein kinase